MRSKFLSAAYSLHLLYLRVRRPLTFGVRCCVENEDGHVLLVRHTYRPGWYFPGGGVDKGETAEAAVARELWEEVGVTPRERLRLFHIYSNFREYRFDHVALYRLSRFTIEPNPNREIEAFGFFDPGNLPEGVTDATRARLAEIGGAAEPGELW